MFLTETKQKKKVSRDFCAGCQHNHHSDSFFSSIKYLCIVSQRYWNLVQQCSVKILAANSDLSFLFSLAQRAVATKTLVLQQKPGQPRARCTPYLFTICLVFFFLAGIRSVHTVLQKRRQESICRRLDEKGLAPIRLHFQVSWLRLFCCDRLETVSLISRTVE